MLTSVLTFIPAAALIVLLPGPDTLVVVRSLLRHGRREAAMTVVGVLSGLAVWVTAASFGLSALLRASETGYTCLKIAGAAYLLFLGAQSLRARVSPIPITGEAVVRRSLIGGGFGAGLLTDLLNPKVGVFFVSFLPGFIPHGEAVGIVSMLLGAIFIALTASYFVVMLLLAGRVTEWMQNAAIRKRMDRITGCVLIGFGIRLATE